MLALCPIAEARCNVSFSIGVGGGASFAVGFNAVGLFRGAAGRVWRAVGMKRLTSVEYSDVPFFVAERADDVSFFWAIFGAVTGNAAVET